MTEREGYPYTMRPGSFGAWLLAGEPEDGQLHQIMARDRADMDQGITWGVYDGDELVGSHPARYMAEADAWDCADASDRPLSDFIIRPVED